MLQGRDILGDPSQSSVEPSHVLVLVWWPPPHSTEQADHSDQSDHTSPESTRSDLQPLTLQMRFSSLDCVTRICEASAVCARQAKRKRFSVHVPPQLALPGPGVASDSQGVQADSLRLSGQGWALQGS